MLQTSNSGGLSGGDISKYFSLIAAVIGALASWAAIFIKQWVETAGVFVQPKNLRMRGVLGVWTGKIADQFVADGTANKDGDLTITVKTKGRKLDMEITLTTTLDGKAVSVSLAGDGGFFNEDIIQFTYQSKEGRKQFGVAVLSLSGAGTNLDGHYAGLSPTRDCFVTGAVHLTKAA